VHNRGDIDIDFAHREKALEFLPHTPASIIKNDKITKHNTGVYFHAAPTDPITGLCSISYEQAEDRGMFKIDMLNVSVYDQVKDEEHLLTLMHRPLDWHIFEQHDFVSKLFHLGNHAELVGKLKPKSVEDLAMILALIRPGKKYLQHLCLTSGFASIANDIWTQTADEYVFRKSHAISYAVLVVVHANLLIDSSAI
jgi:DNA polymerase III alpha subunit